MTRISEPPWTEPCTPGDEEWQARREWFMAQPSDGWMWLSFVDPNKPEGERFLGVAIVPGGNIVQCASNAHDLGINPGGQVAGFPLHRTPRAEYTCKLYADRTSASVLANLSPDELFVEDT